MIEKISTMAEACPQRTAIIDRDQPRSYKEFETAIRWASNQFQGLGVSPGDKIGIYLDNSFESYACIFAALMLRCIYVPLSTAEPRQRLLLMIESSKLNLIVGKNLKSLDLEASIQTLDLFNTPIESEPTSSSNAKLEVKSADPDVIAYLMFTSGTTGEPKGILISESNLQSFCAWSLEYFDVRQDDVFLGHIQLTFDLSVFHLFPPFLAGASVRITPPTLERIAPGRQFKEGVTIAMLVPRMTGLLADAGFLRPGAMPKLRHLLFCGEKLFARQVDLWQKCQPLLSVHNLYGPTEATVACSYFSYAPGEIAVDPVPMGQSIAGMSLSIRDNKNVGELLIAGPQVTKFEYVDGSHAKPLQRNSPVYASGDCVERDSQGNLIWLSRIDDQFKIQGHRVELAEIELKLVTCENVGEVVCAFDRANEKLFAFFTTNAKSKASEVEGRLREICRESLPGYMHPHIFQQINAIPLTKNGKTDRSQLLSTYALTSTGELP